MTDAFWNIFGLARDGAVVLLALEAVILLAVPLLLLFYITKWFRRMRPQVVKGMRQVQAAAARAQALVLRMVAIVRTPFVFVFSVLAVLRATTAVLQRWWHLGGES